MSLLTDIADAVVTLLNDAPTGTFSQDFTAVRSVFPRVKVEDLSTLSVIVWPRSNEIEREARRLHRYTFGVDIAVQKKLDNIETGVAELGAFVDELVEYLAMAEPPAGYAFGGVTNDPHYAPEHIETHRAFTSLIQTTYHAIARL